MGKSGPRVIQCRVSFGLESRDGVGRGLLDLHLMLKPPNLITTYPVDGDHVVDNITFSPPLKTGDTGSIHINKTQYFGNVPVHVWDFHVGGYQVCRKWLKDRKGKTLSYDDIMHYQHIISTIASTIKIMSDIDNTIDSSGGWPFS